MICLLEAGASTANFVTETCDLHDVWDLHLAHSHLAWKPPGRDYDTVM